MENCNNLVIKNATKMYSDKCGIKNISLEVKAGEIVAFVGPNGVGKTTLVKSIAGLLKVNEGKIEFNGISTSENSVKKDIGYMQDDLSFYEKMTVYEILDFICEIKYCGQYRQGIDDYLVKYGLFDKRNTYISKLSLGMQRKLAIIIALLGESKLIILDEPTNGVDTAGILQLKQDLQVCVQKGSVVIITSHVLEWIENICTRCIFLKSGEITRDVEVGTLSLENEYERVYM